MLILWWLVVVAFRIESFVLPSPVESVTALYQYRYPLAITGFATLATTLAGFALAVAFGLALGIIVGSFRLAYAALYPILIAFNSVPKAALVPILVIWFGVGTVPAVMRALGASRWDMVLKIGMPRSLPYFFASLKIAITLSFVGTVIAEIVAGNNGIGNVMLIAGSNFNVPLVFAALLVVGAMGIGMYAIFAVLEHRFAGWSVRGGGIEFAAGG